MACALLRRLRESLPYSGIKSAPAQTLGERFGVDTQSRSDPDGRDDASVDVSIDARPAETEKPSYFGDRKRPLDPFYFVGQRNGLFHLY
jgi:hypothetical protein